MTLTKLRRGDITTVSSWLPAVATSAGYEGWDEEALHAAAENGRALVDADSFAAYRIGAPFPNAAQIEFLAVRPERRRLGIGSRLVLSVERRLKPSADTGYVLVSAQIGLSLYFWLRLGYAALLQPDWPSKPDGASVWMMRRLH